MGPEITQPSLSEFGSQQVARLTSRARRLRSAWTAHPVHAPRRDRHAACDREATGSPHLPSSPPPLRLHGSPSSRSATRDRHAASDREATASPHLPSSPSQLRYGRHSLKVLLVVNSFASSVTARNTVVVHRRLSRHHHVEIVETNRRGHATRFAADAARRGVDVVIGYGGDGTLNEVATGIAGTDTALGVLPGGSTNVFARTIGLENDPVAASEQLAAGLDSADLRPIGLGQVNGRYFCFHTGIGFDAEVVKAVEKRASLKRWLGHPLFITASLSTWLRGYDRRHPHFSVETPERKITDGYFAIVLNTNPYTYLGNRPLDLSREATLDRPLVAITFRTMSALAILKGLGGALRGRGVATSEVLIEQVGLSHLVLEHETPFPYQVDGDYLGEATRLEFTHVPDAVHMVFPGPKRTL